MENFDRERTRLTGAGTFFCEHDTVADTHDNWLMDNSDSGPGAQWETPGLCKKSQKARHILVSFDGARWEAAWVRQPWYCGCETKQGSFEKVSHGGRVLVDISAMVAEAGSSAGWALSAWCIVANRC